MLGKRIWAALVAATFAAALAGAPPAAAQNQVESLRAELAAMGSLKAPGTIVAVVDGDAVDAATVNELLKTSLRGQPVSKELLPTLEAQALEQVISRRLVERVLDEQKITATDEEIDAAIDGRREELAKQKVAFADYIAARGFTPSSFRDQVRWELRWQRYLKKHLTDAELEKFFKSQHSEFDGTEVRVSHIVLRPHRALDALRLKAMMARAVDIRDAILGARLTFAEAAQKYSDGPSRSQGGDLGFIPRRGVMTEAVSAAAFQLKPGEISEPVPTQFGVHLLQCTEIRPGKKTWKEVRAELEAPAMQEMFKKLAEEARAKSEVEYTGAIPYFRPGTTELIMPAKTIDLESEPAAKN